MCGVSMLEHTKPSSIYYFEIYLVTGLGVTFLMR